jgi:hypothetical protein
MIGIPVVTIAEQVQTVHTSGVNLESVVTIIGSVVAILTVIFGLATRYISSRITGAIDRLRLDVIQKLDIRLTAVETKIDTVNDNNPRDPRRRKPNERG